METLTKVKSFLSSWRNLLALGTLVPLGIWIYSRVWMVNPAILGDEYLYSMNSRKAAPWDPSPAGDFSNYLFNFVYQGTNLCGQAFYSCAKVFNLFFFLSFIFTLFIVAIRFLPFWAAYGFMIAAALSPLSVYTSMFLPESMYMFFIGLLLIAALHAMKEFTWQNWAIAGAAIGITSLVKPHAWLSAIAVGITLLVVGLGNRKIGIKRTAFAAGALILGSALSRIFVGLLVAGPKALGFFGQYLGVSTVQQVMAGTGLTESEVNREPSPWSGVLSLFATQATVHILTISALMAISVVGVVVGVIQIGREKTISPVTSLSLFAFVWLTSLTLEIVIFTGWVTGSGDDHTTRVLLRYYEFLFAIVPLAGLAVFSKGISERANVWIRWTLTGLFIVLLTPAFTGFFATLTIQIADAPTLAGMVVNMEVFNSIAIVTFVSLLVFAAFPKFSLVAGMLLLPFSMIGTGIQIQEQYQMFRGQLSFADIAGQFLRDNFSSHDRSKTLIIATSRFDATNVAIWADIPNMPYEIYPATSTLSTSDLRGDFLYAITLSGIELGGAKEKVLENEAFSLYRVGNPD
jgi:hypothetical protein